MLHILVHRLGKLVTSALILVRAQLSLDHLFHCKVLFGDGFMGHSKLTAELVKLELLRLEHLSAEVPYDLVFEGWQQVVLDLEENVTNSLNNLIFRLKTIGVGLTRDNIYQPPVFIYLFDQIIEVFLLLSIIGFQTPLKGFLNDFNDRASVATIQYAITGAFKLSHGNFLMTALDKLLFAALSQLQVQLGVFLLDKVLHDLDSLDDDILEDALSLFHLDKVNLQVDVRTCEVVKRFHGY